MCVRLFCSGYCYFLSAYLRDFRPFQQLAKVSSLKWQKPVVCQQVCYIHIVEALGYLKASNDRGGQILKRYDKFSLSLYGIHDDEYFCAMNFYKFICMLKDQFACFISSKQSSPSYYLESLIIMDCQHTYRIVKPTDIRNL